MAIFNSGGLNRIFDAEQVGDGSVCLGYFLDVDCMVPATNDALVEAIYNATLSGAPTKIYKLMDNIPTWADGTDEQIAYAIKVASEGTIDLTDYWSVGDTRTVSLSAIEATGVSESHVAQDVEIVLMHKNWVDANGITHPFLWGVKAGLKNGIYAEWGYMNSTETASGGWNACARRTWCNGVFFSALPSYLQEAIGTTAVKTADNGASSTTIISNDKCFLPAEFEVFGSSSKADSAAESGLTQIEYYKTADNRSKSNIWWLRSPYKNSTPGFVGVDFGDAAVYGPSSKNVIAPHGCIL